MAGFDFSNIKELSIPEGSVEAIYTEPAMDTDVYWVKNNRFLTFSSTGSSTIANSTGGWNGKSLEYSYNRVHWIPWTYNTPLTFGTTSNKRIYIRGNNPSGLSSASTVCTFTFTGTTSIECKGNVMHLLSYTSDITSIPNTYCFKELFRNATQLVCGPELPATTIKGYCYSRMFNGCSSLVNIQGNLPATTVSSYSYFNMFANCSSLTVAPNILATQVNNNACSSMFENCTSLINPPSIDVVDDKVSTKSFEYMFAGCSALTSIPVLNATSIKGRTYGHMFDGCSALTELGDELKFTSLGTYSGACEYMFANCTSLTKAPVLLTETLSTKSYYHMFEGCSSLVDITCYATNVNSDVNFAECTEGWTTGVPASGSFTINPIMDEVWEIGDNGIPTNWAILPRLIAFTSSAESTVSNSNIGWIGKSMEYSYDKTTWNTWTDDTSLTFGTTENPIIYIRGNNPAGLSEDGNDCTFEFTGTTPIKCGGNIMGLLDYNNDLTAIPSDYCFERLFEGATNLVSAPILPATTLSIGCYKEMFGGCSSLAKAPNLPAMSIPEAAYWGMFSGCSTISVAPQLSATTIGKECYSRMFNGCALVTTPTLPATTLADGCYKFMFADCTSLTTSSELTATTLNDNCYEGMFNGCSSLVSVPNLTATNVKVGSYKQMFAGCSAIVNPPTISATSVEFEGCREMFMNCSSIVTGPKLLTETLTDSCYYGMFDGCSSMKYLTCLATDNSGIDCTKVWLRGVAETVPGGMCIFTKSPKMDDWTVRGDDGIPTSWNILPKVILFTSTGESTIGIDSAWAEKTMQYSYDNVTWETWTAGTSLTFGTTEHPDVYVRGDNRGGISTSTNICRFAFTGTTPIYCYGNLNHILRYDYDYPAIPVSYCYKELFKGATQLVKAPTLPAKNINIRTYCYQSMFEDCTSLLKAPALPATAEDSGGRLPEGCYHSMFKGCTSLTDAPELLATSAYVYVYSYMFQGCSSLVNAPSILPIEYVNIEVYYHMFDGCSSLVTAPTISATVVSNRGMAFMFYGCSSIVTAPTLNMTTIGSQACYHMFDGCTSLANVQSTLYTTSVLGSGCQEMFSGCTSLVKAPNLPATTLENACYQEMFMGCTSLTTGPVTIPAEVIPTNACKYMFVGCKSLVNAPTLPACVIEKYGYHGMFRGCSSLVNAPALPALSIGQGSYKEMFIECGIVYAPSLPVEKLKPECYKLMFYNCKSLETINCYALDISATDCITNWVHNHKVPGTLTKDPEATCWTTTGDSGVPTGWAVEVTPRDINCITFQATRSSVIVLSGTGWQGKNVQYSYDKQTWQTVDTSSSSLSPQTFYLGENAPNHNDCVHFRGHNDSGLSTSSSSYCRFSITGAGNVYGYGNLMHLTNYWDEIDTVPSDYCFYAMFRNCMVLKSVNMYSNATILKPHCYEDLFNGCTVTSQGLVSYDAPILVESCYNGMFKGCSNVSKIKCLATDISATDCTTDWTNGVAASGTFIKDASMNDWPTGTNGIPNGWTIQDA